MLHLCILVCLSHSLSHTGWRHVISCKWRGEEQLFSIDLGHCKLRSRRKKWMWALSQHYVSSAFSQLSLWTRRKNNDVLIQEVDWQLSSLLESLCVLYFLFCPSWEWFVFCANAQHFWVTGEPGWKWMFWRKRRTVHNLSVFLWRETFP